MLVKALTTAVPLAAPQARAGAALSATIVIARPPAIQVVQQGGHQRHWHKPAHQHPSLARHQRPGKSHHVARRHRPQHHAAARQHWGGHQPRQRAQRHGKAGGH